MKFTVRRFLFFCILCFWVCLVALFRFPFHLQSSLNDLFSAEINGVALPKEITDKYANILNIVIEDENFENAKSTADELYQELKSARIENITYRVPENILKQSIDYFKTYQHSFLSEKTRHLLKSGQFEKVTDNVIGQIQTSWIPPVVPLKQDAFLLLSDYIQNINQPPSSWKEKDGVLWQEKNGKNYILILIKMDYSSIDELVENVSFIEELSDTNVHLSGAPIHTVRMFEQTKKDISVISVLAILVLIILSYGLFSNIKSILLIGLNLVIAFLFGTLSVFLFSPSVHFLTFAFGASLIGICIDYSYHRFYCPKKNPVLFQNIFYSFLTTVCCFAVLLFSDFALLKQIALFTIGGLCGTFLWIFICPTVRNDKLTSFPTFRFKFKKAFLMLFFILCFVGLGNSYMDHSPQNLYKPDPRLQKEETFFHALNGKDFSYLLLIKGNNWENLLQKEEKIKENFDFFSVSTLLPSVKRQKENADLIKTLYEKQSDTLQFELGLKQMPTFEETPLIQPDDFQHQFPILTQQFIVETKSGVWSIILLATAPQISDKDILIFEPATYLSNQLDLQATKSYKNLFVSFCVLFFILCLIYKSKAFKYLLPSFASCIATLGILSLLGQPITFFHYLSLFVVIGLSMDYTIFLFNKNTVYFKPILFSFLSSFIGFGLLAFVHFYMVAVIGQTIALGLLLSFCITLILKKD
ncbi:MAG: hypothetical protein J6P93_04590 [Alphaproteobacteria bacterium]|nr:hypothetical protein [Alphaproteobacteria bacterium]